MLEDNVTTHDSGGVARAVGKHVKHFPECLALAWRVENDNEILSELSEQLKGFSFKIYNKNQYRLLVNLLTFAGADIWGWHNGYKSHLEEPHYCDYTVYTWAEHGILKELYPVVTVDDEKTIEDVFNIINQTILGNSNADRNLSNS